MQRPTHDQVEKGRPVPRNRDVPSNVTCLTKAFFGYSVPYVRAEEYLEMDVFQSEQVQVNSKERSQRVLFELCIFHKGDIQPVQQYPNYIILIVVERLVGKGQ